MLISSSVPMGGGLSSSAALEVAAGYALLDMHDAPPTSCNLRVTASAQRTSLSALTVESWNQFVACNGKAGHALMLDCRSLEHGFCRSRKMPGW